MSAKVLIVEDEILVATEMAATLEDLGYVPTGIAADTKAALALCESSPDVALVDLNLRDGPTGAAIGSMLSRRGIAVVFVTANPRMLGSGVPGTIGALSKPCDEDCIGAAIAYALSCRRGESAAPPAALRAFTVH